MKLTLVLLSATLLSLFTSGSLYAAQKPTSAINEAIDTVYDLEDRLFSSQNQFLPIAPPSEDVYVHFDPTALPVNWKKFPKDFTKLMYAEVDGNGFPIYRVRLYEDPISRETVFLNMYDAEVYRITADASYDPFYWQKTFFQLDTGDELDEWTKWIYDPAHIAAEFNLIPEVFHSDYLSIQAEEAARASMMMVPMPMALQLPVTNLQIAVNGITNGAVELEIGWPSSFTNELEIFATTDLDEDIWEVICTGITTTNTNTNHYLWVDWDSTNTLKRYFRPDKADLDSDGDGLTDAREALMYGSNYLLEDTDGDGLHDDVEVGASPPTDPSNDDRTAPMVSIASPVNNIVVVP